MKNIFPLLIIICAATAEARVHPLSMLRLRNESQSTHLKAPEQLSPYIPALMLLDDDTNTKTELESLDVVFHNRRGNIYVTSIPRDKVNEVVDVKGIIDISCANTASVCMDVAREFSFVDAVQAASADRPAFSGKGVVTGISDIGFDPRHIAFASNLRSFGIFSPEDNTSTVWSGLSMSEAATDNADQKHATHVGNILSGSYLDNPYYGVAPGSDFVATTSSLNDAGILMGVEHIIDYAKSHGQRAVVNLSLSTSMGPHDGSSLMASYLNFAAEDAVICISSGNQGDVTCYAVADFTSSVTEATVGLTARNNLVLDNYVDLWSSDHRPFGVRLNLWDRTTNQTVYSSPCYRGESDEPVKVNPDIIDGAVTFYSYLSPANNRYNITLHLDYQTSELIPDDNRARYVPYLTVSADEDVKVEAWTDVSPLVFTPSPCGNNKFEITADGTVNDMATAGDVICVGAASSRNVVPILPNGERRFDYSVGSVAEWSSYASRLSRCRPLPDICAPGRNLISAGSSPYMATHSWFVNSAVSTVNGTDYYWFYDQGTSMASPFAAGVIALWLEADPTLTTDEIKEIATKTTRTDLIGYPSAQWGGGCIDADAGIDEVLRRAAGIVSALPDSDAPTAIYTLSGLLLPHTDTALLRPGVYIVVSDSGAHKIDVR